MVSIFGSNTNVRFLSYLFSDLFVGKLDFLSLGFIAVRCWETILLGCCHSKWRKRNEKGDRRLYQQQEKHKDTLLTETMSKLYSADSFTPPSTFILDSKYNSRLYLISALIVGHSFHMIVPTCSGKRPQRTSDMEFTRHHNEETARL